MSGVVILHPLSFSILQSFVAGIDFQVQIFSWVSSFKIFHPSSKYSEIPSSPQENLDDGWNILKEDSQEKICTWKSIPATKDCNMEKDKGCKITKPDKIGEEKIYLLEK